MSIEHKDIKEQVLNYCELVKCSRDIELRIRGDSQLCEKGEAYRLVGGIRNTLKKKADEVIQRLQESKAVEQILRQALAETYLKDIARLGFFRSPFFLSLEYELAKRFARYNWNSVFFPNVVSTSSIAVSQIGNWLAESISGEAPELVRTEERLLKLLRKRIPEEKLEGPVILLAFQDFHESLLCHLEAECRERKIVLIATQEVEFAYGDKRYQGLLNWTAKLADRYRPEVLTKEEIERQSMWRNKNVADIATNCDLRNWIMDANIWAKGELPLSDVLAEV